MTHKQALNRLQELERKLEIRDQQLREKQAQLMQSEKMAALGSLVAGVAHEINSPLGALNSNNDIFIRAIKKLKALLGEQNTTSNICENPDVKKIFDNIDKLTAVSKTAAERIIKIVNSLRNIARIDKKEKEKANLNNGIESTLTLVHHKLKNRIRVHREFGEIPLLNCYPNQLNQVFMNMLVNAIQAIEGEGDIFIKTYIQHETIIVEIRDTGKGIPKENLSRIFDPGFTTKEAGIGTGLGLSIAKQIIEDHAGKIELESEGGKGSIFRIMLPV